MIKKHISLALTLFTLMSTSVIAFATVTSAGGGTWDYDVNHKPGCTCWSNYTHNSLRHGSTAVNGDGDMDCADGIVAGETSYASVASTAHSNKAYWHRCAIDKNCGHTQD